MRSNFTRNLIMHGHANSSIHSASTFMAEMLCAGSPFASAGNCDAASPRTLMCMPCRCCSGYRGITCVDFCSKVLQAWRKHSADAGHTNLRYQHADIVMGLAFEHCPVSKQLDMH